MKNSKEDSVYYIRTGNKVSQPFRITKTFWCFLIAFMAYFTYITYEYFRIVDLEYRIEQTEIAESNKYIRAEAYKSLIADLKYAIHISDQTIKLYEDYNNGKLTSRKPEESN